MIFRNDQLQTVLNYDTYGRQCLDFDQRVALHKAISHKMTFDKAFEFTGNLKVHIVNILGEINQNGYLCQTAVYYEDSHGTRYIKED